MRTGGKGTLLDETHFFKSEAHRSMYDSEVSFSPGSQRMSAWRLENPFSANADANVTNPLEDCSSKFVQLTKTRGVGASRGAVGDGMYSTDVLEFHLRDAEHVRHSPRHPAVNLERRQAPSARVEPAEDPEILLRMARCMRCAGQLRRSHVLVIDGDHDAFTHSSTSTCLGIEDDNEPISLISSIPSVIINGRCLGTKRRQDTCHIAQAV